LGDGYPCSREKKTVVSVTMGDVEREMENVGADQKGGIRFFFKQKI
jgi:hypothetical protein